MAAFRFRPISPPSASASVPRTLPLAVAWAIPLFTLRPMSPPYRPCCPLPETSTEADASASPPAGCIRPVLQVHPVTGQRQRSWLPLLRMGPPRFLPTRPRAVVAGMVLQLAGDGKIGPAVGDAGRPWLC